MYTGTMFWRGNRRNYLGRSNMSRHPALLPLQTTALYILAFLVGLGGYRLIGIAWPTPCPQRVVLFKTVMALPAFPAGDDRIILLSFLHQDATLYGLAYAFSFSYFCRTIQDILLVYRGITFGLAMGSMEALYRAGNISSGFFAGYLVLEALLSSLLLLYACRSTLLARHTQGLGGRHFFYVLRLAGGHLLRACFFLLLSLLVLIMSWFPLHP